MEHFFASWNRWDEITALVRVLGKKDKTPTVNSENMAWSYQMLVQTSRSFAAVIQELNDELRDAVMVFYLTLRALDTVEDDMDIPLEKKTVWLDNFHEYLDRGGINIKGYGKAHERELIENFEKVIDVYQKLAPKYRDVIRDITMRMGAGMREFSLREVVTVDDYNLYCHYVAGLVGIGLTRMFGVSGLEDEKYITMTDTANRMGLFLQKTNIIRDYLEDINEKRIFWPKEVWQRYTPKLANFKEPQHRFQALSCLNDLVTDAIDLIPSCMEFMQGLRDPSVFAFVCIPQVMAIATLSLVYDNYNVFTGVVKIRKGEAAKLILATTSMDNVLLIFDEYLRVLASKVRADDPNAARTREALQRAYDAITPSLPPPPGIGGADALAMVGFAASGLYLWSRFGRARL